MAREYTDRFRVSDVVDYLGGIAATAKLLGVSATAVGQFRKRNYFPPSRALQIADHFGLTPDWFHNPWSEIGEEPPMGTAEQLREQVERARGAALDM